VGYLTGSRSPVDDEVVMDLVDRHRRACAGFSNVTAQLRDEQWDLPTPCTEWDARAVVEHVIGFHDFLLLRPLGVRANRPKTDPAERWSATSNAMFAALDAPETLDRETALPGGGTSSPRQMLAALTTDVLVHTWDLARAATLDPALDDDLCSLAYERGRASGMGAANDMHAAEILVGADAEAPARLIALSGRNPDWQPPPH
jgi:uncharacterized protein (TIGR03086 family)